MADDSTTEDEGIDSDYSDSDELPSWVYEASRRFAGLSSQENRLEEKQQEKRKREEELAAAASRQRERLERAEQKRRQE